MLVSRQLPVRYQSELEKWAYGIPGLLYPLSQWWKSSGGTSDSQRTVLLPAGEDPGPVSIRDAIARPGATTAARRDDSRTWEVLRRRRRRTHGLRGVSWRDFTRRNPCNLSRLRGPSLALRRVIDCGPRRPQQSRSPLSLPTGPQPLSRERILWEDRSGTVFPPTACHHSLVRPAAAVRLRPGPAFRILETSVDPALMMPIPAPRGPGRDPADGGPHRHCFIVLDRIHRARLM